MKLVITSPAINVSVLKFSLNQRTILTLALTQFLALALEAKSLALALKTKSLALEAKSVQRWPAHSGSVVLHQPPVCRDWRCALHQSPHYAVGRSDSGIFNILG